jgi:hypothetical protein
MRYHSNLAEFEPGACAARSSPASRSSTRLTPSQVSGTLERESLNVRFEKLPAFLGYPLTQ